ncbi:MAG: hypothetical protein J6Y02_20940 [Pseudobutyrivibrio sp.]|nr:hypothetical protein [Pseudobutyrivibrio sp.]
MGIFKVNDIIMNCEESTFGKWVYDIKCTTNNMMQGSCEDKEALRNAIENIEGTKDPNEILKERGFLYADELPELYIYSGRGNGKTRMYYDGLAGFTTWRNEYQKERDKFDIKDVIFNNPATIVLWADGTKTVVKAENEEFDPEKGLAMAIAKKALGNNYDYYDIFKKYVGRYEKKKQKKGGK